MSGSADAQRAELLALLEEVEDLERASRAFAMALKMVDAPSWRLLTSRQRSAHWRRIFAALAEAGAPIGPEIRR